MAAFSTFQDNFDDNSKDVTKWGTDGNLTGATSGGTTVAEQNGRVEITATTSGGHYHGYVSANSYDLTDSSIYVRVVQYANLNTCETQLVLATDVDNWLIMTVNGSEQFGAFRKITGTSAQIGSYITFGTTSHAWWRITHSSAATPTVAFWTASTAASDPPGSGDWTQRWSTTTFPSITAMKVGLTLGTFSGFDGTDTTCIFDGLNTATVAAGGGGGTVPIIMHHRKLIGVS